METRSMADFRKRTFEFQERERESLKRMKIDDTSEIQLANEPTPIDVLNNDIMLIIFSYLTVKDLITIERVSRKWKELSRTSWMNIKELNLPSDICEGFSLKHLKHILKRGGKYITHLRFEEQLGCLRDTPYPPFVDINRFCINLTHLTFEVTWKKSFDSLSVNVLEKLKKLHFGDYHWRSCRISVKDLALIIPKAINIENFSVSMPGYDGVSLLSLTDRCKALSVCSCTNIKDETMEKILERLPNLVFLDISGTIIKPEAIKSVSNQLTSFTASSIFFSGSKSYRTLKFSNLRNLDLRYVDDREVLHYFIKSSPLLEKLLIRYNGMTLSNNDVDQLAELENLIYLDISDIRINDKTLKYLAQSLVHLKVVSCIELKQISTYSRLYRLIKYNPNLTNLAIGSSEKINLKFFEIADKYVRGRSNNVSLTIQLKFKEDGFGTHVDDEIKRLKLKPFDYHNRKGSRLRIVQHRYSYDLKRLNENDPVWCVRTIEDLESEQKLEGT